MQIAVTCGFGVETATKYELKRLGYADARCENGRFGFEGKLTDAFRANMFLRTADRVYVKLKSFFADTFDLLFDGVYALDWLEYIQGDNAIDVTAKCRNSKLFAYSAVQSIVKKAIVKKLSNRYKTLAETGAHIHIEIVIDNDNVSVLLDTSGDGLHKRGYRDMVYEAPIKETLAAALLFYSGWTPDKPLLDAFCGSGTIPVEAALKARNIAPGLLRRFAYEDMFFTDKEEVKRIRREAEDMVDKNVRLKITGFDIQRRAIVLCNRHAESAGVKDAIHFETSDMRNFSSAISGGYIVSNPPYGERLMSETELKTLTIDFKKKFKELGSWHACIITAYQDFERYFGRAVKTRKIFNASLAARIYNY